MRLQNLLPVFGVSVLLTGLAALPSPVFAFIVENAIYTEEIWGQADDGFYRGQDDSKPERVEHTYNWVDPVYGAEFRLDSRAETFSKGPAAEVKIDGVSNIPSKMGWAETRGMAWSYVKYDAAIYNPFGTDREYSVPIIVRMVGYAEANGTGVGRAELYGSITVKHEGNPSIRCHKILEVCDGHSLLKVCSGDRPSIDLFDKKCDGLNIQVGSEQGASVRMNVHLWIEAAVDLGASLEIDPNRTRSGSALAFGFVDPIITIDPSWEHADKFELILSPGIEQGVRKLSEDFPWTMFLPAIISNQKKE